MRKYSTIFFILTFILVSVSLIAYARGYRLDIRKREITGTGLLVATSSPDGAQVFLDNHLTTATNSTINLPPGNYQVKIEKVGYFSWQKTLKVQKEVVTKTDAVLFPSTLELKPLTVSEAFNPSLSTDGTKIVYGIPGTDTEKSGLYVLDMLDRPLSFSRTVRKIVANIPFYDFSKAKIIWAPEGKTILTVFEKEIKDKGQRIKDKIMEKGSEEILGINPKDVQTAFLLQVDSFNGLPKDITPTLSITLKEWKEQLKERYQDQLASLPKEFLKMATPSASLLRFSPDESKVLYQATGSASLPLIINPSLIGANSQTQQREMKKDEVYVYDIKEDKNFKISLPSNFSLQNPASSFQLPASNLSWFPDSRHLILVEKDAISILEYDGTNKMTVYSGPFENSYVFPWPNGSKLVILTTLNKTQEANLYSLGLK